LDVAKTSKEMGAKKVILMASHATFTKGGENFDDAFNKGYFDQLYTTNLSYIPESIKCRKWYTAVDCSGMLANMIICLCNGESITATVKEQEKNLLIKVQKLKAGLLGKCEIRC
jgi:ribose-phosphate pyrophosphokinase